MYSGSCASLTSLYCFSQNSILHDGITFSNLTPGQTYYIRQSGNYTSNVITVIQPPANDKIQGAVKLTPASANIQSLPSYFTHGASSQFGRLCGSGTPYHDVWFYFIADAASHTVNITPYNSFWAEQNTGLTYRIETFDGFAPDSISLSAKVISCSSNTLALSNLTVGDTIYIRIYSTSASGSTSVFSINVTNNQDIDDAAGALNLDLTNDYQYALTTTGATQSLPASGCNVADFPDDDIWLKFTAAGGAKRIIAGYETYDITLQLFSGSPGNLNHIKCSGNILVLPDNLINGNIYYIRAYSRANAQASEFRIGLFGEEDPVANTCLANNCIGPNLVVNPRCENDGGYLFPKNDRGQAMIQGAQLAEGWWSPNFASSDPWNSDYPVGDFGSIPGNSGASETTIPRSGKGMLGILNYKDWNEYITGKLSQPLVAGKNYLVSFNVIMSSFRSTPKCYMIGAFLGNDSLQAATTYSLAFTPQVYNTPEDVLTETKTWKNICGIVHADKNYEYITIGNFGEQKIFGNLSVDGGTNATYFFIDDVVVAEDLCSVTGVEENTGKDKSKAGIYIFPNPAKDYISIYWNDNVDNNAEIIITDISGREIKRISSFDTVSKQLTIDTHYLSPGFYTATLFDSSVKASSKFVISK